MKKLQIQLGELTPGHWTIKINILQVIIFLLKNPTPTIEIKELIYAKGYIIELKQKK